MGKKITLDVPDSLKMDERELLMWMAAHLYGDGKLTMGRAAALVGMTKRAFMESLGRFGVPVFGYGPEGMKREFRGQ